MIAAARSDAELAESRSDKRRAGGLRKAGALQTLDVSSQGL